MSRGHMRFGGFFEIVYFGFNFLSVNFLQMVYSALSISVSLNWW